MQQQLTYEVGISEPLHPDPMVASRFVEIGIDNSCGFGCKIYADPMSSVLVLAHNSAYGCRRTVS